MLLAESCAVKRCLENSLRIQDCRKQLTGRMELPPRPWGWPGSLFQLAHPSTQHLICLLFCHGKLYFIVKTTPQGLILSCFHDSSPKCGCITLFSLDRILPSFFPQAEFCCHFSPHCHGSHSMFVHLKVNALLGAEILFQENKRTKKLSFTEVKVNYIYKKGLTKICSSAQWSCSPRLFFFISVVILVENNFMLLRL